jgi:hypothetical protein
MRLLVVLSVVGWVVVGAVPLLAAEPVVREVAPGGAPPAATIPGSRAADYVGQEVTVEGRVSAIHESPLATVLGFSQNFAGFTASIQAADRDKFPSDLAARLRDRVVRVTGTVTTYRGKPEMTVRDPAQLVLAPAPGPGSVAAHPPPAPAATNDVPLDELRRSLARIEGRLEVLEGRVNALERAVPDPDDAAPAR